MKDEAFTNISHDSDDQVRHLLSSLPRVGAPSDFDFRLRGRIAKGMPARRSVFRLPAAVTYAIGLGVVLVVFGLGGMAWMYNDDAGTVPAVAVLPSASTTSVPSSSAVPETAEAAVPVKTAVDDIEVASKRTAETTLPRSPRVEPRSDAAVSANVSPHEIVPDAALKNARSIYPKGINPNAGNPTPDANVALGRPVEAKDVLFRVGLRAAFSGGALRVESVTPGSAADKGGVKAGDIIQAINGEPVTVSSAFTDRFSAKTLLVVRDGQTIQVTL